MDSKRPLSQEDEELDGVPAKRSQLCHHCCREVTDHGFVQTLILQLEPMVRRAVQEEVRTSLVNYGFPAPLVPRPPIQEVVRFQLHFQNRLPGNIFTDRKIKAENDMPIEIVIKHTESNEIVKSSPFSSLKIDIVVLDGEFCGDGHDWTKEEFSKKIQSERNGNRPLLTGALSIRLSHGVGHIVDAKFTDNSSWKKCGFRLGAMVSDNISLKERVREGISEAFRVKDCRAERNQKDSPPLLNDEVWHLQKIRKDGPLHRKLEDAGINTVQDFLRFFVVHPSKLRELLGRMPKAMWETTVAHAFSCNLGDKLYSYCTGEQEVFLVFNSIFQLVGANFHGLYRPFSELDPSQKDLVNKLKTSAYENSKDVLEFLGTLKVTSIPGSSISGSYISHHPFTSHDTICARLRNQPNAKDHETSDDLTVEDYISTEQGFNSQQSASFQMPDCVRAANGFMGASDVRRMTRLPPVATSILESSFPQIVDLPSAQLGFQHQQENLDESLGNQYQEIYAEHDDFHRILKPSSPTNNFDAFYMFEEINKVL